MADFYVIVLQAWFNEARLRAPNVDELCPQDRGLVRPKGFRPCVRQEEAVGDGN